MTEKTSLYHCISSWLRAIPTTECPQLPPSRPASAWTSLTLLPLPDVRRLLSQRAWDGEGPIKKHQQLTGKNQGCSHLFACSPQLQGNQLPPDLPTALSGHKGCWKRGHEPISPPTHSSITGSPHPYSLCLISDWHVGKLHTSPCPCGELKVITNSYCHSRRIFHSSA